MSYRMKVNGTQIFGNNESYQEWDDFLKSKGVEIDEDGCYDAYIDDLQGMFNVIDTITRRLIKERHEQVVKGEKGFMGRPYTELTDLSNSPWLDDETPLLRYNMQMINYAYCFLPYQVFKSVEDIIEESEERYLNGNIDWGFCSYKLKDGAKIHVHAG